jgi:hypothetical protein
MIPPIGIDFQHSRRPTRIQASSNRTHHLEAFGRHTDRLAMSSLQMRGNGCTPNGILSLPGSLLYHGGDDLP